ncbi:carboxymuconolactone decarboxylase family protein [Streptomyces mirabilis]|uniref:carboxymuconolactone decarboxylase family protein n=1 Tax=Streptomyces mirabilis TaxID=68239 RepID=UPI0036EFF7A8
MARLQDPNPEQIPEDVANFVAKLPADTLFTMLTHSPSTIQPFITLAQALYTSLDLPVRSRELAILVLADAVQCEFVLAQHGPISKEAGVDEQVRRLIRDRDYTNPALSEYDRAVIQFAAEVALRPQVSDTTFSEARKFLTEREVVELLQLCGYYWTLSRVCTVLEVDLTRMYANESVEGFPTSLGDSDTESG